MSESVIEEDKGRLFALEEQVVESLKEEDLISKNLNLEYEQQLTLGQRMADEIADFGGSWQFIGIFGVVLVLWMLLNSIQFITKPFDPYPFIFLNLILSCLAAIQAPIIMMSQNRQEEEIACMLNMIIELISRQNWKFGIYMRSWTIFL